MQARGLYRLLETCDSCHVPHFSLLKKYQKAYQIQKAYIYNKNIFFHFKKIIFPLPNIHCQDEDVFLVSECFCYKHAWWRGKGDVSCKCNSYIVWCIPALNIDDNSNQRNGRMFFTHHSVFFTPNEAKVKKLQIVHSFQSPYIYDLLRRTLTDWHASICIIRQVCC